MSYFTAENNVDVDGKAQSQTMTELSFPVTKVFCFLKNWEVWKKEQRNFKDVGESKRVKNFRPDYLFITLNLIDSIVFCQRIFEITMKSTPHHAPSIPSFIQFINCEVNENMKSFLFVFSCGCTCMYNSVFTRFYYFL